MKEKARTPSLISRSLTLLNALLIFAKIHHKGFRPKYREKNNAKKWSWKREWKQQSPLFQLIFTPCNDATWLCQLYGSYILILKLYKKLNKNKNDDRNPISCIFDIFSWWNILHFSKQLIWLGCHSHPKPECLVKMLQVYHPYIWFFCVSVRWEYTKYSWVPKQM